MNAQYGELKLQMMGKMVRNKNIYFYTRQNWQTTEAVNNHFLRQLNNHYLNKNRISFGLPVIQGIEMSKMIQVLHLVECLNWMCRRRVDHPRTI